jgi:ABC-type phosphate transport system ATPase subunit
MIKCSQSTLLKCLNKYMSLGIYPEAWAEGYITPLYKTNDISDPSINYRRLTTTSSIGKLFNRVLNARLDTFLIV